MTNHLKLTIMGKEILYYPEFDAVTTGWLGSSEQKYYELIFANQQIIDGNLCVNTNTLLVIALEYFGNNFDSFRKSFLFQIYYKKYENI